MAAFSELLGPQRGRKWGVTMRLIIKMDLGNAAFEECGAEEVGRILASVAERIPDPLRSTNGALNLHDFNGNHVGTAEIR